MKITESQYRRIEACFPHQRGNVSISNLEVLNAILYVAEHGCKWRGLPLRFGNWHTIYTRMNRWAKAGVLDRVFAALQDEQIIRITDRSPVARQCIVKCTRWHRRAGCGPQAIGKSRGGWTTKIHMVAADARTAITFSLSPGHNHDAPEGWNCYDVEAGTFHSVHDHGPGVRGGRNTAIGVGAGVYAGMPPKQGRVNPWQYDRVMYRRRNEIERLFRRLRGFRRIFSRFDKLDVMFTAFIHFALIVEALR